MILFKRLPIPETYTSEATTNAFGFLAAKKDVFSPFPKPISKIFFLYFLDNSESSFGPPRWCSSSDSNALLWDAVIRPSLFTKLAK